MSIKVNIENPIDARIKLKARKTLDGNIMIIDHPEIDIVLSPTNKKVLALAKESYSDKVYNTESRLMEFLSKNGVIDPASIHSGNVFGSLEGKMLESMQPNRADSLQMTLYVVTKFLIQERPHYNAVVDYENKFEKELLDPDPSTPLGKVPHEPRKGTSPQYAGYNASFGMFGMYE